MKLLVPSDLRSQPRQAMGRENVDLLVADPRRARHWLQTTPDTYRVRGPGSFGLSAGQPSAKATHSDPVILGGEGLLPARRAQLLRALDDPEISVSVLGGVGLPHHPSDRLWINPVRLAVRRAAWQEVGGEPGGSEPWVGLLDRLRDAGHRLAVRPVETIDGPANRTDPIEGAGSAVILAGVPLHDVGGGSRGAQLTLELLRHGYHVTYVAHFTADESTDLGLRFIHPRLEQYSSATFDPGRLAARLATRAGPALVELPLGAYLPVVDALGGAGYRMVYDLLDRWSDASLGGGWYDPATERELAGRADALIASAPALVSYLRELSNRPVVEVPNGVNVAVFSRKPGPVPGDFPAGDGPVFGYQGSLYGDWFDWDELTAVAEAYPDARVVVIGDPRTHPALPSNLWLLGLKAQNDLPDYVGRFDVGLIPFEVSATTQSVSPLKAFEYLAMGVPVAAPPLETLTGLDGVHVSERLPAAVADALSGPRPDAVAAQRAHGWAERLGRIFRSAGLDLSPATGPEPRVIARPAVHYRRSERLL